MVTIVMQGFISLFLACITVCAFRKTKIVSIKIAFMLTAIASVGMTFLIVSQFVWPTVPWHKEWYRMFVFIVTASELAVITALLEYMKWKI